MLFNSKYCEIVFNFLCRIWGVSYFSPLIKFKKIVSFLFLLMSLITVGSTTILTVVFMDSDEYEEFENDKQGLVCAMLFVTNALVILIYTFLYENYEYKIFEKISETKAITKKLENAAKIVKKRKISGLKTCLRLFLNYIFIVNRVMFANFSIWFDDDLDILNVVLHPLMIIILFCYHYEKNVGNLGRRFGKLNKIVDHKFQNGDMRFTNRKKLDEFFWDVGKCYDNLHESSQLINKRFGTSIFLAIFSSLAIVTYTVFHFFIELEKSQRQNWNLIAGKMTCFI